MRERKKGEEKERRVNKINKKKGELGRVTYLMRTKKGKTKSGEFI